MSKVLDVLTAPWAIQPQKLIEIRSIYAAHLRGDKVDLAAVEARLGQPLENEQKDYWIKDGVAVIPIHGVLAKRMNMFSKISGGSSSQLIGHALDEAVEDGAVHSIVLHIDSPGGSVDGTQALMQQVREAAQVKKVVAVADGMMASAAYWIGSAADEIYITDGLTDVGSIGVVSAHVDESKKEEMEGEKYTEIYAGKYKRIASSHEPLTSEGRQVIQDQVDYVYSIFIADVAENRGITPQKVLSNMADGRVFIGQQAIDAGLVDGISSLDESIDALYQSRGGIASRPSSVVSETIKGGSAMSQKNGKEALTREALAADSPALLETLIAEGHSLGLKAGADAERARIQAVEAQSLAGHEALIAALKFDGTTSGAEAALAVLNAERGLRSSALSNHRDDAPVPAAFAATQEGDVASDDQGLSIEDQAKQAWDESKGLQAEFGGQFDAYQAYRKAEASGALRIQGQS